MSHNAGRLTPSVAVPQKGLIAPLALDNSYHKAPTYRPRAGTVIMPAGQPAPVVGAQPGGPTAYPPGSAGPMLPNAPTTIGTPSYPQQWQSQQTLLSQNVSTPVAVVTQPQVSVAFTPPSAYAADLGPMVPPGVAAGVSAAFSSKCMTYGLIGAALAFFFGGRRSE